MWVEPIGCAVLDFHVVESDVRLLAARAVFLDAADEPSLMARVVGAIAVDHQVLD